MFELSSIPLLIWSSGQLEKSQIDEKAKVHVCIRSESQPWLVTQRQVKDHLWPALVSSQEEVRQVRDQLITRTGWVDNVLTQYCMKMTCLPLNFELAQYVEQG